MVTLGFVMKVLLSLLMFNRMWIAHKKKEDGNIMDALYDMIFALIMAVIITF